jgi:hypothetical protein
MSFSLDQLSITTVQIQT